MKYYATALFFIFFIFYTIMQIMAVLNSIKMYESPFEFILGFLLAFSIEEWKNDKNP